MYIYADKGPRFMLYVGVYNMNFTYRTMDFLPSNISFQIRMFKIALLYQLYQHRHWQKDHFTQVIYLAG